MEKIDGITGIDGLISDSNRYKSDKGLISMLPPCRATMEMYEIYCLEGGLFEDTERFDNIEDAETRIGELLN